MCHRRLQTISPFNHNKFDLIDTLYRSIFFQSGTLGLQNHNQQCQCPCNTFVIMIDIKCSENLHLCVIKLPERNTSKAPEKSWQVFYTAPLPLRRFCGLQCCHGFLFTLRLCYTIKQGWATWKEVMSVIFISNIINYLSAKQAAF